MHPQNPKTNKTWRIIDIINWGEKYLKDKSFDSPRNEIEILLLHLIGCKKIDLYLDFEKVIKPEDLITLRGWIKRRVNREPIQHIIGHSEFYGRRFIVNQNVLIPRPETETVIDISIDALSNKNTPVIIDIGTGSGCIGITLALEIPRSKVFAIDISEAALSIAKKNAAIYNLKNIEFIKMDFLRKDIKHNVDLLVSNPPYIPQKEISSLMRDVKEYEPMIALTDNSNGLVFYQKISKIIPHVVKKNGVTILEVGRGDHHNKVKEVFSKEGYSDIETICDLNKDIRVLMINN